MAPVNINPPGYGAPSTLPSFIIPASNIERRRRLADILAQQGTSTEPVRSWTQAAARVAQSLAGVMGNVQANTMERQRYKALGDAMRGGATPEQMMATGDPQMIQAAQFAAEMAQRRLEAQRQEAMLGFAAREASRADVAQTQSAPGVREAATIEAQRVQGLRERAAAASRYITAARGIQSGLGQLVDSGQKDANGQPIMTFKANDAASGMFGPIVNSPLGRGIQTYAGSAAETNRRAFDERVGRLSHDYAIVQDPNHPDFQGARGSLPSAGSAPDAQAAYNSLEDSIAEAQRAIDEAGGVAHPGGAGAGPATSNPLPPPGAPRPQHPFQGAPAPQPAVNAGEVPRPVQAAPQQGGGPPMPNDADTMATFTPETWAALPPAMKEAWIRNDTR